MMKNTTAEGTFINLVRSVINNEKPVVLPEGVTADELYEIGLKQKMVSMILCALNMISPKPVSDNWGKYITLLSAGCLNSEEQMQDYHKLVEYLCDNGVKIIPLKGCAINGLYPSVGLRTMSDVDLLYSGVDTKRLAELMKAFGYTMDNLDSGCHDTFHKGNVSIELHRKLIPDNSPYRPVLENMFDKAVADVFFTRTSETPEEVGLSAVLLEDIPDCAFSGFVLRGRPKNDMLVPEYCKYCFSAKAVREKIISNCTYTTRALTNGRVLSAIEIPVPSKDEQLAIASALTDMERHIANLSAARLYPLCHRDIL